MDTIARLKHGKVMRIENGLGTCVTVARGSAWITEQGSDRDVILAPGQSYRLGRKGLALISAFGREHTAVVSIQPA
jgi:hypothetical protein